MEDQLKKLIPLEKYTDTYKLIIPANVERKIRHLCNRISQVEWSGTLFYTYSGSYEDNNLEIKCVDIFPMDIGSQAYTEFDMSPDVIAYMTEHPELLDCQMGLIHSHNNMATFFSGTDTSTLREEGNDRNHFVSLIVNNAGTYTAAITRKLNVKRAVHSTYTYKSFDDIEKLGTIATEVEEEVIAYNMLDIIKEGAVESFQEIDDRLDIIRKNKAKSLEKSPIFTSSECYNGYPYEPSVYPKSTNHIKKAEIPTYQSSLFKEDEFVDRSPKEEPVTDDKIISIDASVVRATVLQLITGSIAIADASRIDPVKWANQMVGLFDKRFNNDMDLFKLWIETMSDFILTSFIPEEFTPIEENYISELSKLVYMSLDKLPRNKYIDAIQDSLLIWMK